MANNYYNHGGAPAQQSALSSSVVRAEFDAVTAGFNLLPSLTSNGLKIVRVNAGTSALEAVEFGASVINAATAKTTPISADQFAIADSAAAYVLKNITWGNILSTLSGLYVSLTSATGSAKIPSGSTGSRDSSPVTGYFRFNTDTLKAEIWTGSAWGSVGGAGATGSGSDTVFNENSLIVTQSYMLTAGKSANSVGPITINSGVTVTVPSGARWVVL